MSDDRSPTHVLGWLTTSANYTVITSFAPPEHRSQTRVRQVKVGHRTTVDGRVDTSSAASCTRKDLVKSA